MVAVVVEVSSEDALKIVLGKTGGNERASRRKQPATG